MTDAEFIEQLAFSYVEPFGDEQRQQATIAYWQSLQHLGNDCPPLEFFMATKDRYLQDWEAQRLAEEAMTGDEAIRQTMLAFGQNPNDIAK